MENIDTASQLGHLLVGRRKLLRLSQVEVADRIGLSQNRLSVLESHPATLTVKQLLALADVLGLELSVGERASAN